VNKRSIEIYRLWKEEGYKKTELAKRYGVSRARIGDICNSIEHEKKTFSDFISELPLRMRVHVLRNRFGDENKATPETVAKLDPLELERKTRSLGK
jgi:hypothetical protein